MEISAPNPVTIPSTEAKVYPNLWIYNLNLHSPSTGVGTIKAEFLPYNAANGDIAPGSYVQKLSTNDLWAAVQEVPEVATAYAAILNCVAPLTAWVAAKEAEAAQASEVEETPVAEVEETPVNEVPEVTDTPDIEEVTEP